MKTLISTKINPAANMTRNGNYDDYQSYVDDQTQYNKEVRHEISFVTVL